MPRNHASPTPRQHRILAYAPVFVLLLGLVLTGGTAAYVARMQHGIDRDRFEDLVEVRRHAIQERLQMYITLLRAGSGLFAGSNQVTRGEFHIFVQGLGLRHRYPGVQGIGFARRTRPHELESLTRIQRADGFPDFHVWPEGLRDEYEVIAYLEPLDRRNQAAIGYDMFSEPVRRAAMEQARDSGLPAATGKVTLVQEIDEQKQAGFLVYAPVYAGGTVPASVDERREKLLGFVYSPFRVDDLLTGILGNLEGAEVGVTIYDGGERKEENVLNRSYTEALGDVPRFSRQQQIEVGGRNWTVAFAARPDFDESSGLNVTALILLSGGVISVSLALLSWSQWRGRQRAEAAAAELQRSEEALRQSEARLRRLADANLIGIVIADVKGSVLEANEAFLQLIGAGRDELPRINWLSITAPEYQHADAEALRSLRERARHEPFEKELIRADGTRVPVFAGMAYLGGPEELCVGFLLDLTERKQAERALARYRDHLEALVEERTRQLQASQEQLRMSERLASIGTLATGIAHEINNPVNAILLSSQYALTIHDEAGSGEEVRDTLRDISKEAVRCGKIVKNVLRFAKRTTSNRSPHDLNEIVSRAADLAARYVGSAHVNLQLDLADELPPVRLDPLEIEQVIVNLVQNAGQMASGRVNVRLHTAKQNGGVELTVADDGPGIQPESLRHIFDPFFSTRREQGGTGLGLSVVHGIITEHGGMIEVESSPGLGAAFRIHLPCHCEGDHDGQDSHR